MKKGSNNVVNVIKVIGIFAGVGAAVGIAKTVYDKHREQHWIETHTTCQIEERRRKRN